MAANLTRSRGRPAALPRRTPVHQGRRSLISFHRHPHAPDLAPSATRSRDGVRIVGASLVVLALTALLQLAAFFLTDSVALLGDLLHNASDAATALPLGAAFLLRSRRAEQWSGWFVVGAILVSAGIAGVAAVARVFDPRELDHLSALAIAGALGFGGNALASLIRVRGGRRIESPALVADGLHARADAVVSLSVVAGAAFVATGWEIADPLIGLAMAGLIVQIAWQAASELASSRERQSTSSRSDPQ